jgi:hypothetical protein
VRLTRQQILAANDLPREAVPVPEWDGEVEVRAMTASERDSFEARHREAPYVDLRARLAAATICAEDGSLVFSADDVAALGAKSAAPLDRIFSVAARLSGITKQDEEDLRKN